MNVYIVTCSAMEESSTEGVYAHVEDAVAKCRKLAEEHSARQKKRYADSPYSRLADPKNWKIQEKKIQGYEICLCVGYHKFSARGWKVQT